MFAVIVAARGGLATCVEGEGSDDADPSPSSGERLVRVPIDELQQAEHK